MNFLTPRKYQRHVFHGVWIGLIQLGLLGVTSLDAQVKDQPIEEGDLLPFIDVGHKDTRVLGNWVQDERSLFVGPAADYDTHASRWLVLPFVPDGSLFVLELDVERSENGHLLIGIPFGRGKARETVECVFDFENKFCGPVRVGELNSSRQFHELKKKSPTREFDKLQLPMNKQVTVRIEASPERIVGKVGTATVFAFDVDLEKMVATDHGFRPRPRGALFLEAQTAKFRFTRIHVKGKGTVNSVSPPGTFTRRDPEPPARSARRELPPPQPLPPPVAELVPGTWKITMLSEHNRFMHGTLHIVSSQKGDVRGALQWSDPKEGAWAFEILHGQIAGDRLTLTGIELQSMGFLFKLGRYPGEISPDGKSIRNLRTVYDGQRIRNQDAIERWSAEWTSPDVSLSPRTQAVFDLMFRDRSDEDALFWQFTEQRHTVEFQKEIILRGHRADRLLLPRLSKSANPQIAVGALAMMQLENLSDVVNGISNISDAVNQIDSDVQAMHEELSTINSQYMSDQRRAWSEGDVRERMRKEMEASSRHSQNTWGAYLSVLNSPGARSIALTDLERLRIMVRGKQASWLARQQFLKILQARNAPAQPLAKSWSFRVEAGPGNTSLLVTNTSKETLHQCVFVTELKVDPKKLQADWDKQEKSQPMGKLLMLLGGASSETMELSDADRKLMYELASIDSGYCIVLPEWRPKEQLLLDIAPTGVVKYGKSATLAVWTDETGLQESRVPTSQLNDAVTKLQKAMQNPPRKK